jgi:hypothetical protein
MLARFGDRLSYANVVATLALFVALGGTGYAASQITTKDVKNRSLKGGDLRKDTITGTEVNESKLKQVPKAREAESAGTADISKSAGTATLAGSATTAALADTAKDAQNLAGQGVAAFEKSSRTSFGKVPSNPAGASGEAVVLDWPAMGVQLTSATNQGACAGDTRVAVRNTKASGPDAKVFETNIGQLASTAPPGGKAYFCSSTGTNQGISGVITDSTGRSLFFDCQIDAGELRCLGVRSEP